jgi:excisionase family DNA binding protein
MLTMPPKRKALAPPVVSPIGEVYTTEEVAGMLKLSVRTILRAIEHQQIEARKAGKAYLITREAVQRYWESLPLTTATAPSGKRPAKGARKRTG